MNLGALGALALALTLAGAGAVFLALRDASVGLTNPPGYVYQPGLTALPPSENGQDPSADFGLEYSDVRFPSGDGATLSGWLVAAPAGTDQPIGVVAVHGRGSDRRDFLRHLPMLHDLGATTLLFDLREHGLSDGGGRGMSLGVRETEDIRAAVRYLKDSGVQRVVVLGVSLGAGSAILAAAADPAIDAVIAESPFTSMPDYIQQMADQRAEGGGMGRLLPRPTWWPGLVVSFTVQRIGAQGLTAPIDVVERIAPRPLVLIHGTADTAFVPRHSTRLFERAQMPKVLWMADGASHTRVFDAYPTEYRAHVAAVIEQLNGAD